MTLACEYTELLNLKKPKIIECGFEIDDSILNKNLFDFQRFIVKKAVKNDRKAIGCELKDSYFDVAVKNLQKAESKKLQLEIFL